MPPTITEIALTIVPIYSASFLSLYVPCLRGVPREFGFDAQNAARFVGFHRRPLWICRSPSGGVCRWSTDGEFLSCLPKKGTKEGHEGLRPCDPYAASGWPSAKVGGALSRMSGQVYSTPPAAAPRAQCLCRRVSGTVPEVLPGRHVRFCMARSAHGKAENCAATPRTRSERANARYGRCFPLGGSPRAIRCALLGASAT